MVTMQQFKRGVDIYFTSEVFPKLPESKKFMAAFGLALLIETLHNNETVKAMRLIRDDGMVDVERAYSAAKSASNVARLMLEFPVIGAMSFDGTDIDRLYSAIMN